MTPEQMMGINFAVDKLAQKELRAANKALGKYNGRFKDLADTQRIIEDYSKGNPLLKTFSSDISSYSPDILDELKVGKFARKLSWLSGKAEGLSLINKPLRNMQFNTIAEKLGKDTKEGVETALDNKIEKANQAHAEFKAFRSQGTLEDIAMSHVLGARATAHSYGVENLEDLGSQISNVREGKALKPELFNDAMYNAQLRKFVEPSSDLYEETLSKELKDVSRQTKLLGKLATSKNPWGASVQNSTVGYLLADEFSDNFLGGIGNALLGVGSVSAAGYLTKRTIDGAINKALAEASRLMENPQFKEEIDYEMRLWSKDYEAKNGHPPSDTEYFEEAEDIVHRMVKRFKRGKDIPDWAKGNGAVKAAIATNSGELFQ